MVTEVNLLDCLYIPLGLITAPIWMRKRRDGWNQRFGRVADMVDASGIDSQRPRVMLHAVSVGEVNALRAIVPLLTRESTVFVSTTTDTGLARARSLFGDAEHTHVVRYPLDCSWMVDRFLDEVRPDVVGLVELEVWPNFIKRCVSRGIPVGLINGRLSARSFKGYRKIRPFLRPTFRRLSFACVQDQAYKDRIAAMGAQTDRVRITGTMKWDSISTEPVNEPSERARTIAHEMGVDLERPLVVAGSTGPTEESLMHESVPGEVQLIIAPRKTERFDEAADSVPCAVRRSNGKRALPGTNRFILDTIGELSSVYELADIVVMGRSFNDQFGSDPIEPAALGKPVIIGFRYEDFESAVGLLLAEDAIRIETRESLRDAIRQLLDDPAQRDAMGQSAQACVRAQQGASEEHARVLLEWSRGRESG
jgi:3-deoxy-D-manno-octulosonic-acid transferase